MANPNLLVEYFLDQRYQRAKLLMEKEDTGVDRFKPKAGGEEKTVKTGADSKSVEEVQADIKKAQEEYNKSYQKAFSEIAAQQRSILGQDYNPTKLEVNRKLLADNPKLISSISPEDYSELVGDIDQPLYIKKSKGGFLTHQSFVDAEDLAKSSEEGSEIIQISPSHPSYEASSDAYKGAKAIGKTVTNPEFLKASLAAIPASAVITGLATAALPGIAADLAVKGIGAGLAAWMGKGTVEKIAAAPGNWAKAVGEDLPYYLNFLVPGRGGRTRTQSNAPAAKEFKPAEKAPEAEFGDKFKGPEWTMPKEGPKPGEFRGDIEGPASWSPTGEPIVSGKPIVKDYSKLSTRELFKMFGLDKTVSKLTKGRQGEGIRIPEPTEPGLTEPLPAGELPKYVYTPPKAGGEYVPPSQPTIIVPMRPAHFENFEDLKRAANDASWRERSRFLSDDEVQNLAKEYEKDLQRMAADRGESVGSVSRGASKGDSFRLSEPAKGVAKAAGIAAAGAGAGEIAIPSTPSVAPRPPAITSPAPKTSGGPKIVVEPQIPSTKPSTSGAAKPAELSVKTPASAPKPSKASKIIAGTSTTENEVAKEQEKAKESQQQSIAAKAAVVAPAVANVRANAVASAQATQKATGKPGLVAPAIPPQQGTGRGEEGTRKPLPPSGGDASSDSGGQLPNYQGDQPTPIDVRLRTRQAGQYALTHYLA